MSLPSERRLRAIRLLHRYFRTALSVGRIPSAAGVEIVRVRHQKRARRGGPLEAAVIFACDIERCLEDLSLFERHLIAFCIFENHSEWEAARHYQQNQTDLSRRLCRVLDRLYATFCRKKLLAPVAAPELADGTEDASHAVTVMARGEHDQKT
jgi:hypothetical protein